MRACFENFIFSEVITNSKGEVQSSRDFLHLDDAAEPILDGILSKFGRNFEEFFDDLEKTFEREGILPWAVVLFSEEFHLAGHVISLRKNRKDCSFTAYSIGPGPYNIEQKGPPPVSVLVIYQKFVLQQLAEKSQLFNAAWTILSEKPEDQNWVCIADSPSSDWVASASKDDDQLFMSIFSK